MCIGSTTSLFSTFVLALASFVCIWNYSKIKENIKKILTKHFSKKPNLQ